MSEIRIESGDYSAEIRTMGAGLSALRYKGRDLVDPFIPAPKPENYRGDVLAPWPNRIEDGQYEVDGNLYVIPINEPNRETALHGLVNCLEWDVIEKTDSSVLLKATLRNSISYPTDLEFLSSYSLSDEGLTIEISATNIGRKKAPYGVSIHPYLIATPNSRVDDWSLKMSSSEVLEVDMKRLLPIGERKVEELDFDFRTGRLIGDQFIDHAFKVDQGSELIVTVAAKNGDAVEMTFSRNCEWIQIHTADRNGGADSRICLAVEPMTCPPNAFRNADEPIWLAPGDSTSSRWKIEGKANRV
jgi:aldose 1-epimerase